MLYRGVDPESILLVLLSLCHSLERRTERPLMRYYLLYKEIRHSINSVNVICVLDTFKISTKSLPNTGLHHRAQNPHRSLSKLTLELLSWEEDDKR